MVANKSDFDLKEKQKILFGLYQGAACLFGFTAVGEAFAERYMYIYMYNRAGEILSRKKKITVGPTSSSGTFTSMQICIVQVKVLVTCTLIST